ncbi:hypothetical protein PSCLAVI8L_130582 [Pseudoclavibacter sp. 8L]|nr:hypothetical protein PSCLAVI8L_130582 [Pseudoclavibacter sp. 8L]
MVTVGGVGGRDAEIAGFTAAPNRAALSTRAKSRRRVALRMSGSVRFVWGAAPGLRVLVVSARRTTTSSGRKLVRDAGHRGTPTGDSSEP